MNRRRSEAKVVTGGDVAYLMKIMIVTSYVWMDGYIKIRSVSLTSHREIAQMELGPSTIHIYTLLIYLSRSVANIG